MIQVHSNVEAVTRRLYHYRANVNEAAKASVTPQRWEPVLRLAAERALEQLAAPEEQPWVAVFVRSIEVTALQDGFVARLSSVGRRGRAMEQMVSDEHIRLVGGDAEEGEWLRKEARPLTTSEVERRDQLKDWIRRWVEEEKRRDERDLGYTDEEVADRIEDILFAPMANVSDELRDARAGLTRRIGQFIALNAGGQMGGLTAPRAALWLEAVLAAWVAAVRRRWPEQMLQQLGWAWKKAEQQLL